MIFGFNPLSSYELRVIIWNTSDVILEETSITGEKMSDGMLPYVRPPVFIVGTHADKPFEDIEVTTSKIQQGISGKEYEKHVIRPFFNIDNTLGKKSLSRKIKKVFGFKHQAGKRLYLAGPLIEMKYFSVLYADRFYVTFS